jgi:C1A family cysteine protease
MKRFGTGFIPDPELVQQSISPTRVLFGAQRLGVPRAFSLAHHLTIRDQEQTNACVGFAWSYAIKARFAHMNIRIEPSPRYIYTLARMMQADPERRLVDVGSTPHAAAEGVQTYGIVQEHTFPFASNTINDEVPWDILNASTAFVLRGIYRLTSTGDARLFDLKQSISRGYPVFFGTFMQETLNQSGNFPIFPDGNDTGGHALCVVGYDGDVFEVANSWGRSFGDKGFCRVDGSFLTHALCGHFYVASVDVR